MLTALESKDGPPKGYMAEEAVQKKQARRLAESSFKTKLETGKFSPGGLSEKVKRQNYKHRTYGADHGGISAPFLSSALVVNRETQISFDTGGTDMLISCVALV